MNVLNAKYCAEYFIYTIAIKTNLKNLCIKDSDYAHLTDDRTRG